MLGPSNNLVFKYKTKPLKALKKSDSFQVNLKRQNIKM